MKTNFFKILTPTIFILGFLGATTAMSNSGAITITVKKNDAYASICSRSCESVESCIMQAKQFDLDAGKKGLLKSITIRANGKTLLNRTYRNPTRR